MKAFFFSSRRRHTISDRDWSSDVCSSDLSGAAHAGDLQRDRFQHGEVRIQVARVGAIGKADRKSTRLNSSHDQISYAVFCLKKKKHKNTDYRDKLAANYRKSCLQKLATVE